MDDTIAAIASPPGQGAVALVRISGPGALGVVEEVFRRPRGGGLAPRVQTFGEVVGADGEVVDSVLLTHFPAPASYTGEDVVEIGCHGGRLVTSKILETVLSAGARAAEPGEFSKRAFLNGKMDLTQAEAVMDLIGARTSLALRAAGRQLEGELGRRVAGLREALLAVLAQVEAHIDFPEEDIDPETAGEIGGRLAGVADRAGELVATAEQGRILREGMSVVLSGLPNAGKSSLLNVLLGFDRAIVSDTAGTTRDTLEESINLGGIPVRLIDTAGLRESGDGVEREGVSRAEREVERADLVLEVVDGSLPRGARRSAGRGSATDRRLLLLNKSDLGLHPSWSAGGGMSISCKSGEGVAELVEAVVASATGGAANWGDDLVTVNARHRACLEGAQSRCMAAKELIEAGESPEFVAVEVREALDSIGQIVGKADVEELLGTIFSSFCIGK